MLVHEHVQNAKEFLKVSDAEFISGDNMQAAEKLWGAANQAVMAVAKQRGWDYGRHYALKTSVQWLTGVCNGDNPLLGEVLSSDFNTAETFNANFYHNLIEDFDIATGRPVVRRFVNHLLDMVA